MATTPPAWLNELDPNERAKVMHALSYSRDYTAAGAPGHNHILLIAKLARLLDQREVVR